MPVEVDGRILTVRGDGYECLPSPKDIVNAYFRLPLRMTRVLNGALQNKVGERLLHRELSGIRGTIKCKDRTSSPGKSGFQPDLKAARRPAVTAKHKCARAQCCAVVAEPESVLIFRPCNFVRWRMERPETRS